MIINFTNYPNFNCTFRINKLPNEEIIDYNVEEQELISNYIDPILSPILHRPEQDKLFLW